MAFSFLRKGARAHGQRSPGSRQSGPRSTPPSSGVAAAQPEDLKMARWYMNQAASLERDRDDEQERRNQMWKLFAGGCFAFAVLSNVGSVALVVLKRPNPPPVLRVDTSTGAVTVLPTQANGRVTWEEKVDRHNLEDYVETREGYDWETINSFHNKVMLESDPKEQQLYDAETRSKTGDLQMYKDQVRAIVKAGPTTFVGDTAQVFFCKRFVSMNTGAAPMKPEFGIATVKYRYVNVPENTKEQDIDPTGFRVSSYKKSKDWTRSDTDTAAAVGECQ